MLIHIFILWLPLNKWIISFVESNIRLILYLKMQIYKV